jgi:hypothetical protein
VVHNGFLADLSASRHAAVANAQNHFENCTGVHFKLVARGYV